MKQQISNKKMKHKEFINAFWRMLFNISVRAEQRKKLESLKR